MDASTAKVPNHGSSKQIVCSSTPGRSSERLKALCILGSPIHAWHSPQQHWRPRKWHSGPRRRGMAQGSTGANTYQVGLERTEQAYVAESWWLGVGTRGNQLCMKYLTQNPLEDKPSDKIIWDGTKRVYFIIPYNFSEWGGGGVVGSWQTLPWPRPSASRYPWGCLSSFSHVVLEEIDNHVCCWVRVKDHVKPVRRPLVPARMADLGCTCELRWVIQRTLLNSDVCNLLSFLGDAFGI